MRQIARVDQTAYNEKRYVTATQVVSSWDPEAQEVSDDSPTLSQPAVTCFKGQTFVPVSVELYGDAATLEVEIRKSFLDSKTQLEANAFTLSTGSAQPRGIVTAVSAVGSSIVTTGTNTIAVSDLFANQSALPPRWRPNAKWAMNLSILNAFRQLPQATGLNFSVVSDATVPPKALGWDIHENSSMDGTLSTGSDLLVLSGDFQQFAIVDRVPSMIEYVPTLFGAAQRPTGQRGFVQHWRVGSDVLVADAFRISNYNV